MGKATLSFCPKCNVLGYRTSSTRLLGTDQSKTSYPCVIRSGINPYRLRRKQCDSCGYRESTLEVNATRLEETLQRTEKIEELLKVLKEKVNGD